MSLHDTSGQDLATVLRQLANSNARPKTARLRDLYSQIEMARAAGVQHKTIVQTLREHGFEITDATYYGTLKRIRAQLKSAAAKPATPPPPAVRPVHTAPPAGHPLNPGSHNPAALDLVMGAQPDLDSLTRHATRNPKK